MKKLVCLLLVVAVMFSFVSCIDESSSSVGKETYEESDQNEGTEVKEETFGLNESAVFEDLKITAIEITETNGDSFFTPESGNVFVGVKFVIENVSDEEQTVSSLLLFDAYVDDVKNDYSFNAACAFDEGSLDGNIAPGKRLEGFYPMEVSQGWQNIELCVKADWLSNQSATFAFAK